MAEKRGSQHNLWWKTLPLCTGEESDQTSGCSGSAGLRLFWKTSCGRDLQMNYGWHTPCQESSTEPAPVTLPSSPAPNLGTKLSRFGSEKATQIYYFFFLLPSQNCKRRWEMWSNDLALKRIAVWIFFIIYLFGDIMLISFWKLQSTEKSPQQRAVGNACLWGLKYHRWLSAG